MKKTHLLKKIRYLLMAIGFPIILLTLFIVIDGVTDERKSADLIVILGNKINPDGNPVERLAQRLDKGLELYQDSLAPLIMVSGGIAEEGFAEGTVMADYLIKKGVPQSAIVIDNDGWKTFFTAKNAKILMDQRGYSSALVVSQYYHVPRTKLAFRRFGITEVYGAHADGSPILRDFYSLPREVVGYIYYFLRKYK